VLPVRWRYIRGVKRLGHIVGLLVLGAALLCAQKAGPADASQASDAVLHYGCCDASAGVAVSSNLFLVANDEDSLLRVYRRDRSGPPVQSFAAQAFLDVDPRKPETDLEGATRVGDRIYWITSHGRNREGEARESRHRFFATTVSVAADGRIDLKAVGRPYQRLLSDFIREPRLKPFNLGVAALHAPKEPNALNIEGLGATPNGELLIGFRNPIPNGRALIVPLANPAEVVEGAPARFNDPILLNLDGRGVRAISHLGDRYLILAGSFDAKGRTHFYEWSGAPDDAPRKVPESHFKGVNPEGLVAFPGTPSNEFQILSDDGTRKIGGLECKLLPNPLQRHFRSFQVQLDKLTPLANP
jgi:hypothetical protein